MTSQVDFAATTTTRSGTDPVASPDDWSTANLVAAALRANQQALGRLSSIPSTMDWNAERPELIERIAGHTVPRWHFPMLNDHARSQAYLTALQRQVVPGSHVLDIGSGTGLLAMMAARAGAGRVTTCEANPLLAEIARQVVAANDLSDVVTVVPRMSTELRVGSAELPTPADLVVSEIVDCGLVGEGLIPTVRHCRDNLLAPGGVLLPRAARMFGFLVESEILSDQNQVSTAAGFDVRLLNLLSTRGHYPVRLNTWPHVLLSSTTQLFELDLAAGSLRETHNQITVPVLRNGLAHALIAWFELDLGAGVCLHNSPAAVSSHWMQALVPLPAPLPVRAGEQLQVQLRWCDERLHIQ